MDMTDRERMRSILTQSIVMLCKTGLSYDTEISVEGLLGITLDKQEVFLVNIQQVVSASVGPTPTSAEPNQENSTRRASSTSRGIKRKCTEENYQSSDTDMDRTMDSDLPAATSIKRRPSEDNNDVIIVKEEEDSEFLMLPYPSQPYDNVPDMATAADLNSSQINLSSFSADAWPSDDPNFNASKGQNDNTYQVTLRHVRLVRRWLAQSKNEHREVEDIPVEELDSYLADMWLNMRRQDGQEYGIGSLGQIKGRLDYYLKLKTGGTVSLQDPAFEKSNRVLAAKRSYLKNKVHANKVVASWDLTPAEEDKLWERGILGSASPETLLFTVYFFCSKLARENSNQLCRFNDITFRTDSQGTELVQLRLASGLCDMGPSGTQGRNPAQYIKEYIRHRPPDCCMADSPLYLMPLKSMETDVWYGKEALPHSSLERWKMNLIDRLSTDCGRKQ